MGTIRAKGGCRGELLAFGWCCLGDKQPQLLDWWKTVGSELFPHVSGPARTYLGIRATQASAERVFSRAGRRHTEARTTLLPQTLREHILCHRNLPSCEDFWSKRPHRKAGSGPTQADAKHLA